MAQQIPGDFFERLEQIYRADVNLREAWASEEALLRQIIPAVVEQLSYVYTLVRPLGVGGSGVVVQLWDRNLETHRALKISRPSPGKERLLARVLDSETKSLLRLAHPNLIQIFAKGAVTLDQEEDYPFYVMDFFEDVQDSDEFVKHASEGEFLRFLHGVLSGLEYMHRQGTIHMDIKPANILVTADGIPVISDLGFAKQVTVDSRFTLIGGTEGYIHPELLSLVQQAKTDPNRLRGEAQHRVLRVGFDLYSTGKTVFALLDCVDTVNGRVLSPYTKRYIRLLAARLLDGRNTDDERALGLSLATLREIKYESVSAALVDLEKLIGSFNIDAKIPELNLFNQDTIQISTIANTPFTPRIRAIVHSPEFARLGNITQLGLLNLVYPTAVHTRLEHSLGTFSIVGRYIRSLYSDPLNPLFRQIMDEADLRAALLASLLHDIGQYPLAHDLEEAEPRAFSHEDLGTTILRSLGGETRSIIEDAQSGWGVPIERIISILEADPVLLRGTLKDRILHTLINGPIDADKLDYLTRDSSNLGLPYGAGIDLERLLRVLTVVFRNHGDQTYAALGIHEKGKVPAESIAFARYSMFGAVYWHHAYRSVKIMLQRLVWDVLASNDSDTDRRRFRDDFRAFVLPRRKEPEQPSLFALEVSSGDRELFQIHRTDLTMLEWLAARASDHGKELVQMLKERTLFKRVIVLTRERMEEQRLWDKIAAFYTTNRRNWRKKLRLQQIFQRRIKEMIDAPVAGEPQVTKILTPEARSAFLAACDLGVVVLVDIPPSRSSSETALEYIIEEDRRRVKVDQMRTATLEESVVWKTLQDSLPQAIGKVRIFCHPDHSGFLEAYLPRERIEDALAAAVKEADAD